MCVFVILPCSVSLRDARIGWILRCMPKHSFPGSWEGESVQVSVSEEAEEGGVGGREYPGKEDVELINSIKF